MFILPKNCFLVKSYIRNIFLRLSTFCRDLKYRQLVKNSQIVPQKGLNNFAARYRIAKSLQSIDFGSVAQDTQNSYFAALRVQLSYNALESFGNSIAKEVHKIKIKDSNLCKKFRSGNGIKYLTCLIDFANPSLSQQLKQWISEEKNDNLNLIARVTRHSFAHGHFTPFGCSIARSKTAINMLHSLANQTIISCDYHLNEFIKSNTKHF